MNKLFFEILTNWPKPYISGTDLHHLLNKSPDSRYSIIKRARLEGYLLPIRKDLYEIKSHAKNSAVDVFEIAPIIYGPSYISFESALSYHGWIPEAVRSTTCASTKRTKEFNTPLGIFSYKHVPTQEFHSGVEQHQQKNYILFIANPWKALADMIYVKKNHWETLEDLSQDLRIEIDCFENSDKTLLIDLSQKHPSTRVKQALKSLLKGLRS